MSNLGLVRAASRVRQSTTLTTSLRRYLNIHERKYLSHTAYSVQPGTHSIVSGPLEPPLSELTLPDFYRTQILPHHASRPALISRHERNVRWDFAEFDIQIERMARGLLAAGIKPGDRVATIMGNCSAYAVLQWACARIGAVIVTVNPAYKVHEIVAVLNAVTASTLILTPTLRKSPLLQDIFDALPTLASTPSGGQIHDPMLPSLRRIFVVDNTGDSARFREDLHRRPCAIDLADVASAKYGPEPQDQAGRMLDRLLDQHDVINLQFTSGTTGLPKAVSSFSPKEIVRTVSDERCTALHGVPTHFIGVLDELDRVGSSVDMSSLRTGIAAGSPVPIDLMRKLIERLNLHDLTIAYGMTETSPVSFQTTPYDRLEMRVESVGKVQPHVHAKIIDEHGVIVPVGVPGELCISGYLLQKGYWENPEQTSAVMKNDEEGTLWMHTGDQAVLDQEGYLKITGRIKDLIIRGGENLSPVQIENCLTSHPKIVEAAAIAVPDARFGEVVGVWILLRPDATSFSRQEAVDWVKKKMNPQNAPSRVWILGEAGVPAELPKTASGKVMKNVLRGWAKKLLPSGNISLWEEWTLDITFSSDPHPSDYMRVPSIMGTDKQPVSPLNSSSLAQFFAFLAESNPSYEFVPSYQIDPEMQNETCYRHCANPILASECSRIGSGQLQEATKDIDFEPNESIDQQTASIQSREDQPQLQKFDRHRFDMIIHPEGLPYFYQDKFVTSDNLNDPHVKGLVTSAVALICCMLRHLKDIQDDFKFHDEVELCVELKSTEYPPKFNYYIADHAKQIIFWADSREPGGIQEAKGAIRDNILREEYWKHVEYYPCHREVPKTCIGELKNLMAAYATDAATSEGSTSPMSAKDIASHMANLNAFGEESNDKKTWAAARLFGLFIRSQILNRYGMQNARLDRFASLEESPPTFRGHYACINKYFTLNLGDKHLQRCARAWADRIAYTESWRAYKEHYLKEWKEIRRLACMLML
ncbi:hypothetical protein RSOLAG22IIIB_05595 [Rhizoctonia solani]|uniref:Acyl-CoA synthetase YngI n=1 Tax=Rhizoctonia solani TaxID=456999 RepID=A0A0K6G7U5_9AGAM|nr:hypothetical protein RSOLAG22IIIB_05595 [Rhizoctonia solani]